MYARKIISEYDKREAECTKKWNDLLNENILNSEKIQGLKVQLHRQRDTFQSVITENERRLADANEWIASVFNEKDKKSAAEFLVSQIELLKEERWALLEDNDALNIKLHDQYAENESLRKQMQVVEFLQGNQYSTNPEEEKQRKMFWRIEELEDLLIEMKQKSGVSRIVELEG